MGVILKGIGGFYYVLQDDKIIECKARGKFRLSIKPLVGDNVDIDIDNNQKGYIMNIKDRKNELIRPNLANVDKIVAVVSKAAPETDLFLIDKLSAIAKSKNIDFIICINKIDKDIAEEIFAIYTKIGYNVVRVCAKTGYGIDALLSLVAGSIAIFTGNSGVGKSSILNHICSDNILKVGDISDKIGRGKHTTRHSELFKIGIDTFVCDTPGFSSFETDRMDLIYKEKISDSFIEFKDIECKFKDCAHIKERECNVLAKVESGDIAKSRHESYVKMYNSACDIKLWEKK